MNTQQKLEYLQKGYYINLNERSPIEIPNTNRETLAMLFNHFGYTVGAEIGTLKGEYAEVICKHNPQLERLFCVDPYISYPGYREHKDQDKLTEDQREAQDRLADYNVRFIEKYSVDAAEYFALESLDFVYIDANHRLKDVVNDIVLWADRVKKGGIISGHDYLRHKKSRGLHVVQAVQAYTDSYEIKPYFVLGAKNAKEGELRDKFRSWFWIKQ